MGREERDGQGKDELVDGIVEMVHGRIKEFCAENGWIWQGQAMECSYPTLLLVKGAVHAEGMKVTLTFSADVEDEPCGSPLDQGHGVDDGRKHIIDEIAQALKSLGYEVEGFETIAGKPVDRFTCKKAFIVKIVEA